MIGGRFFFLLLVLVLSVPCAHAADSSTQTVDVLLHLLDGSAKQSRMDSLQALRKAGFSYQQHLVVPVDVDLSCKRGDEREVVDGMRSVDWDYAVFFGQPIPQGDSCIVPYTKGKAPISSPPLQEGEWAKISQNPTGKESRAILMRRTVDFQRKMLQEARSNPQALQDLGARLYGATLESLYITIILVLAAEESHSLNYIKKLHAGSFARQNKVFTILLRNRHLGAQEHNRERAELVGKVQHLLEKKRGKERLANMSEALLLIQAERDRYLSPCPR